MRAYDFRVYQSYEEKRGCPGTVLSRAMGKRRVGNFWPRFVVNFLGKVI